MQITLRKVYFGIRDFFKETVDHPDIVSKENESFKHKDLVSIAKVAGPYALIVLSLILFWLGEEFSYYSIFLFIVFGIVFSAFRKNILFSRILSVVVLLYFMGVFAYNNSTTSKKIEAQQTIPQIKYRQVFSLGATTTLPQALQYAIEKRNAGFKDIKVLFYKKSTYRVIVDTSVLDDMIRKNPYGYEALLLANPIFKDIKNGIEIFESN